MSSTKVKLNQLQQDGASGVNDYIKWNGTDWSASTLDADLVALANLSTTGYISRTGTNTYQTRSFSVTNDAASTAQLAIGNSDGVSGNTVISIQTDNATLKMSVEAATTANITLSGTQTIDGVSLSANNRCLVKNQNTGSENGIYVVSAGAWSRSTDYNTSTEAEHGLIVYVQDGTVNGNKYFKVDQKKPTIGTTAITFSEVFVADGNGIYSGSGTIPAATAATVSSTSEFRFLYSNADSAILVDDLNSSVLINGKGVNGAGFFVGNTIELNTIFGARIELNVDKIRLNPAGGNIEVGGSSTASELRFMEPSGSGSNYTGFKAPALAANLMYTLPTSATDGYFLKYNSSGNQLEWAAASGGNGIYGGSGTIATNAVATLGSGSSFTIDFNGGNNAFGVGDSLGSVYITDKTGDATVAVGSTEAGVYFGVNSLILDSAKLDLNAPFRFQNGSYIALDSALTPATITSNQNDYAPTGINAVAVLRLATDASREITGIVNAGGHIAGRILTIINIGSNNIVLKNQSVSSAAANRFLLGSDLTLTPEQSITLYYDDTTDRWRPIHSLGGNGIYGGSGTIPATTTAITTGDFSILWPDGINYIIGAIPSGGAVFGAEDGSTGYIASVGESHIFNGTAKVAFPTGGGLQIYDSDSTQYVEIKAPSTSNLTTSYTLTLPTTDGSAGQYLKTDGSGVLSWDTPSGGSGDITNGGNTTGATIVIGTNDANALEFETNNVTRMQITGGASTGGQVTITNVTANTNTVQDVLILQSNSTGTAAANFGSGLLFQGESSTTNNRDMVELSAIWTTATDASRTSALVYSDVTAGGALTERFRFTPSSMTTATNYTIGNSSSIITVGGSSGQAILGNSTGTVTVASSGSTGIKIQSTHNTTSSTANITFGNATSFTQTSGTRNYINYNWNFSPTSGTAVHNQLVFSGTFNQTGGANGITRGIHLNQTLTAVADFRGIEIAYSNSNAKGIYQTGANTTNNFVGRTAFGTTSAPDASALVDIVSTTAGLGLPSMTTAQVNAISSPRDGLIVYDSDTDTVKLRSNGGWVDLYTTNNITQRSINAQTGTSYTLVLSDAGKLVTLNNASAITLTIPTNASVAFPVGTVIDITQFGAGQVTVGGSGVTINSADGDKKLRVQYSSASLLKTDTDTWLLVGDISS